MKPNPMNIRVLVLAGDKWHPAETIRRGFAPLGELGFDFIFIEDGIRWTPDLVREFQVIVLAKANMVSADDEREWLTAGSELALADYIRGGGGLLVIHAGSSRYEKLPAVNAVIGGAFVSHPDQCEVEIDPVDGHSLVAGVAKFVVCDEHYFMAMSGSDADIFLHSRSTHGTQPAGWTRKEGRGRVCVLTPGHNLEVWLHPDFQKIMLHALRWMAKLN
jgi:type 1 glutamine amidotransferase